MGGEKMVELLGMMHKAGVPIVAEKVRMLFGQRGIATHLQHKLVSIEPGQKRATFEKTEIDAFATPPQFIFTPTKTTWLLD